MHSGTFSPSRCPPRRRSHHAQQHRPLPRSAWRVLSTMGGEGYVSPGEGPLSPGQLQASLGGRMQVPTSGSRERSFLLQHSQAYILQRERMMILPVQGPRTGAGETCLVHITRLATGSLAPPSSKEPLKHLLEQCCPIELSAIMEMFYFYTVQYCGH